MDSLSALAPALGISFASGISFYATVAFVGLAEHLGWLGPLPGILGGLSHPWVFGTAGALAAVEVLALLVPGVATTWEALHTAIRPFGAGALAVMATWGTGPSALVAGLLGAAIGLGTNVTKLGVRAAIDTSPEPLTNGAATAAELGAIATVAWTVWQHPWVALAVAAVLVLTLLLVARAAFNALRRLIGSLFATGT